MTDIRIASLCAGYGGLDQGLMSVMGGSVAWHCENDPRAAKVLAARYPGVPNYGDLTAVRWTPSCESCGAPTVLDRHGAPTYRCDRCCRLWPTSYFPDAVEPVDWLTAGFPCQDVSPAGKRVGITPGSRSGLWYAIARVIDQLRPANVLIENSRGLLSARADRGMEPDDEDLGAVAADAGRAVGVVLGDLADIGYDARWTVVRASDAGAPHERARVFVVASLTAGEQAGPGGFARPRPGLPSSDADRLGRERAGRARGRRDEGRAESARLVGRPDAAECRCPHRRGLPAIACCAAATGCCCGAAPDAERGQLQRRGERGILASSTRPDESPARQRERDGHAARDSRAATPDADRDGLGGLEGAPDGRVAILGEQRSDLDRRCDGSCAVGRDWRTADGRDYGPAIRRWHDLTRCVPEPTVPDGRGGAHRLSPRFTEWMMGLPAGWVTDILPRSPAMKCLGNGCVPAQVALAVRTLLGVEQVAA